MELVVVFGAQFMMILLLGLQQLNVQGGHYTAAFVTSLALGVCAFKVTSVIGAAKGQELTALWWTFVFAGPCGIVTAMKVHPLLVSMVRSLRG